MTQKIDGAENRNDIPWEMPTADCYQTLDQTTLDLWLIPLYSPLRLDLLSLAELDRFNRYRFEADRRKFAVARSSLRQILARYTHKKPMDLVFDYGARGKPSLRGDGSFEFNLSHSGDYALCGVARQSIGVDIEQLRPMDRLEGLIQRCLAASEQQALVDLVPDQKAAAFLKYWTCKEAYLKATGQGISESLPGIETTLTPVPTLKLPGSLPWALQVFTPCQDYTAAVVMPPLIQQLRYWDYGSRWGGQSEIHD